MGAHSKSQWQLDGNSDLSSPFYNDSALALTAHLATDSSNLDAEGTYYGRVRYKNQYGWGAWSNIASVVNVAPPPPGSCSGGSNEPPAYTQLTCRDFDAQPELGWSNHTNAYGAITIETDVTAPTGGNNNVGRITHPAGAKSAEFASPKTTWYITNNPTEVYAAFYHMVDAGWEGHPSGVNKVMWFSDDTMEGGGSPVLLAFNSSGSGPGQLLLRHDAGRGKPKRRRASRAERDAG